MTKEELEKLTVNELENMGYSLTEKRQAVRREAMLVQEVMSEKIEAERVAKILGKPVAQSISPAAIDEPE